MSYSTRYNAALFITSILILALPIAATVWIWTGDWRWFATVSAFLITSVICGVSLGLASIGEKQLKKTKETTSAS